METDREDGTESGLSYTVDVNENRASGCKTHRPQPLTLRTGVFKHTATSGENLVTPHEPEISGVPEVKDGESKAGTSGHIRRPDGETGYNGEINSNLIQNRGLDSSDAHETSSGLSNSPRRGEDLDHQGFYSSPPGRRGTTGCLLGSGETSDTTGSHSWFRSGIDEINGLLKASEHLNTLNGEAGDVWEIHPRQLLIGESNGNRTMYSETSDIIWPKPGDAASIAKTNGNLVAPKTVNASNGQDVDVWEFHASPVEIEGTVSPGESSSNQTASGEIKSQTHVSPPAVGEPSGTKGSNDVGIKRAVGEKMDAEGANGAWTASGEMDGWCTQISTSGAHETNSIASVADDMVDIEGSCASLSISRDPAGIRRSSPVPEDVKTADAVNGEPVSMRKTGQTQAEAKPINTLTTVDRVLPQDQAAGNPHLGNDTRKAEFATWENPDCQVSPWACVGKRQSSCSTELEIKIPNGGLNCGEFQKDKIQHEGVRVGNCGYLVINRRTIPGNSSIPVYSIREPCNDTECQQEARRSSDLGPETFSKLPVANVNEETSNQETETRPDHDVDCSDRVGVVRPRILRTNPGQTVSLSCDSTPLKDENAGYFIDDEDMEVIMNSLELCRRQSAPEKLQESESVDPEPSDQQAVNKRHGFTDFLTRSVFSWKPSESKVTAASSGWRLFGKISPKEKTKDSRIPQQPEPVRRKNLEFEPLSTTGLILEDRPANLPAKSEEEAQRHRQQYNEMMAGAKRRELKEAQKKKKEMKERHRQEESIARAVVAWNMEILPNWENMRNTRRVRELWWQGLPPSIRGKIWSLAIGNELNITPELYEIFLSRAKEKWRSFDETGSLSENEDGGVDKESSLDLIKLDIFRTFPSLYIFQKGGPYHDVLHNVLGAYTCYRPDVGYVQGMSFIAAVLILNLEEADAFIAFANLLNKPCQLAFFRVDHDLMLKYFSVFEVFFSENLPRLFQHFHTNSLTPDFYLIDWIFTLYSKPLPLDVACRVWDLFCRDGEEALFRTALGILRLYQDVLLQMDFIHSAQFLSRLPQNTPAHTLFTCIANTHMISNNRRWNQVFTALMKDGPKEADKTGSPALRS